MSQKSVKFHLINDDYFGTLATVLGLLRQISQESKADKKYILALKNIEKELMYLQKGYTIVKK